MTPKLKYAAAIALLVWLGVTAWMATMVVAKPAIMRSGASTAELPTMAQLREGIARNQRALQSLQALGEGTLAGTMDPLIALSPSGVVDPFTGDVGTVDSLDGVIAGEHVVSLVLSHGKRRRAVIDGRLVGPGARLGDGSRVRAIGVDWVAIEDARRGRRVLRMPPPYTAPAETGDSL